MVEYLDRRRFSRACYESRKARGFAAKGSERTSPRFITRTGIIDTIDTL